LLSNEFFLSEYTKVDVGWASARPHWGSLQRSPDLLVSRGPLRGRRGMKGRGGKD